MQDRQMICVNNTSRPFPISKPSAVFPCLLRLTADSRIIYVSRHIHELFGYYHEEIAHTYYKEYCHGEDYEAFTQKVKEVLTTNKDYFEMSLRMRNKVGEFQDVQAAVTVLRHLSGELEGLLLLIRNVHKSNDDTEIRHKEEYIEYCRLLNHLSEAVIIICEKRIVFANQTSVRLFEANGLEEIIGESIFNFIHPIYYETCKNEYINKLGITGPIEIVWKTVRGNAFPAEIIIVPFTFNGKKAFQVLVRDVTERKKAEKNLIEAEKLSIAGQLAAGIAHEIRNPLTALKGFLQLMKLDVQTKNDYWAIMESELERIEAISKELLFLAKPLSTELKPLSLNKLIQEVSFLLGTQAIMHNIQIHKHFPNEEFIIYGNEVQMKQVFINLIKNAIEVMPNGGHIFINVEKCDPYVKISVIDQGCGISEENLGKIGQPFFSTKEGGTGLGLMVTYNIVRSHQGTISVSSQLNVGTTFTILLPLMNTVQFQITNEVQ